ncbi:hypothetical protein OG978_01720 [Streptomyces sp. NBC_01591]|uniref:hypothetical protein n=1 Tax=Streptomyces sp. NBC_01591 TaxID=2975888 RepID=UPI002DDB68F4|nr:hypothetical protein [Streptomyces sp. NBC_01591]WSD66256.1 hypothetical protein OG978_01720 [Streptomyces sp. NBC_01591]
MPWQDGAPGSALRPLHTFRRANPSQVETADAYEPLAAIVADRAPHARLLNEITAHAGDDHHSVWLDESDQAVWHARSEPGKDEWTLDHKPAAEAVDWITETLTLVLDRVASPEQAEIYEIHPGLEEDDLDALDELESVRLTALQARSTDPAVIDSMIRGQMDQPREEIRLLAWLRAGNLKQAFGTERGAAAAAGARNITPESARRSLAAAAEFDARVHDGAKQARLTAGGGQPTT